MMKRALRAALWVYGLIVVAATLRAWQKFGAGTAALVLCWGLFFAYMFWWVWRAVRVILFGVRRRIPTASDERPPARGDAS